MKILDQELKNIHLSQFKSRTFHCAWCKKKTTFEEAEVSLIELEVDKYYYKCKHCEVSTLIFTDYPIMKEETKMKEKDPTGREQHEPGAKLDQGKVRAGLLLDFSLALNEVAKVLTYGAEKYTPHGWQSVPGAVERYRDAGWRHRLAERNEQLDPDSGLLHKAHEAWNILAELEMMLREENKNQLPNCPEYKPYTALEVDNFLEGVDNFLEDIK